MRKVISLDGDYKLYSFETNKAPTHPSQLTGRCIPAQVPGNVELDFVRAGLLPDPYVGDNVRLARALERRDFWYVREFNLPAEYLSEEIILRFEGVDTIAEYFINGMRIGESGNMFVSQVFRAEKYLHAGENELAIHIFSPIEYSKQFEILPQNVAFAECYESLHVRKAAHSYGWDILPRAVSAGIWRSVSLEVISDAEIGEVYLSTARVEGNLAVLVCSVQATLPDEVYGRCKLNISGVCGEHSFEYEYPFLHCGCTVYPYVNGAKLWQPAGYGFPHLYDICVKILYEGKIIAKKNLRFGIRKAELLFSEEIGEKGVFEFRVNGKRIRCRGANWTPLDIYHSRDREKIADAVQNFVDANCNLIRVWGGGVYEDEKFFELCDEKGLMVWQDFMLACHGYPMTEEFLRTISQEVSVVVRRIRNHPSLVLYCGSNETDWAYVCVGLDPNRDPVTRKTIPDAIFSIDPYRSYLPSTPYFSEISFREHGGRFFLDLEEIERERRSLPEEHFWWHRDDFLRFAGQDHQFISEIGFSGSPSKTSLDRMLPKGWHYEDNDFWREHSFPTETTRSTGYEYLFKGVPDSEEDRIRASRLYQAEAYKFVVETSRIREKVNGIVLWNMRDGYPVFASSLVDYYGEKKPAFFAVKMSFEPLQCFVAVEDKDLVIRVVNDFPEERNVQLKIWDGDAAVLFEGELTLSGDSRIEVLRKKRSECQVVFSRISVNGKAIENYRYIYENKIDYMDYLKNCGEIYGETVHEKDI